MRKVGNDTPSGTPSKPPLRRTAAARPRASQSSYLRISKLQRWSPREASKGGVFHTLYSATTTIIVAAGIYSIARVFSRLVTRSSMGQGAAPGAQQGPNTVQFSVATFNLRGVMDRWLERRPLLGDCIRQINADVLCFQEVLTGEFEQDRQLLGESYTVFPCKAALFNLLSNGGLSRWYAQQVSACLSFAPLQRLMVRLPPAIEAWRERYLLRQDLFRNIRDLSMAPFFGNSVACRLAKAHEINHSTLVLGDWRAAQRIEFSLGNNSNHSRVGSSSSGSGSRGLGAIGPTAAGGGVQSSSNVGMKFWVVNSHLDHAHPLNRQRQAIEVCRWMEQVKHDCAAIILCGDFNGGPDELFHKVLREHGYVSAYRERHGREPRGTWPTGIEAPLMDHGSFECLDYIYVWTAEGYKAEVLSAELFGLDPAPHDKTLYPSDHAALRMELQIQRKPPLLLPDGGGTEAKL